MQHTWSEGDSRRCMVLKCSDKMYTCKNEQNLFQLGHYGLSLLPGAPEGLSSSSLLWDELFGSLKVLPP